MAGVFSHFPQPVSWLKWPSSTMNIPLGFESELQFDGDLEESCGDDFTETSDDDSRSHLADATRVSEDRKELEAERSTDVTTSEEEEVKTSEEEEEEVGTFEEEEEEEVKTSEEEEEVRTFEEEEVKTSAEEVRTFEEEEEEGEEVKTSEEEEVRTFEEEVEEARTSEEEEARTFEEEVKTSDEEEEEEEARTFEEEVTTSEEEEEEEEARTFEEEVTTSEEEEEAEARTFEEEVKTSEEEEVKTSEEEEEEVRTFEEEVKTSDEEEEEEEEDLHLQCVTGEVNLSQSAGREDEDQLDVLMQVAASVDEESGNNSGSALSYDEQEAESPRKVVCHEGEEEVEILIQAAASADESRATYGSLAASAGESGESYGYLAASAGESGESYGYLAASAGESGESYGSLAASVVDSRQTYGYVSASEDNNGETLGPAAVFQNDMETNLIQQTDEDEEVEEEEEEDEEEGEEKVEILTESKSWEDDEEVESTSQSSASTDEGPATPGHLEGHEDGEESDIIRQASSDSSEESNSLSSEMESDADHGEEENEDADGDDNTRVPLPGTDFYLNQDLFNNLYSHQKEGVRWLWDLHHRAEGGILGDDMGLGKTIQIIAFLSGLFGMRMLRCVLIVVPVTVMANWQKEFKRWAPRIAVMSFHGTHRHGALHSVHQHGGVLLTTYGTVVKSWQQLSKRNEQDFVWDYVILDEGHKIKNPTKTTKGVNAVMAKHRVIMTGTPIQNNLKELWTLFDYTHQGKLFRSLKSFKREYESPIVKSRERDASQKERRLGIEKANSLKEKISPYFLRRTKADVSGDKSGEGENGQCDAQTLKMPEMTYKNDLVIWLYLSENQVKIYRDFLELDSVQELLMKIQSPLVALNVLKKICDHPRLLSVKACHQLGLHGYTLDEQDLELPAAQQSAVTRLLELSDDLLVEEAGKMGVLIALLDNLRQDGHRCLVFSQSRKMLDIIQKVLQNRGHKIMRLDGKITQTSERERRVQEFQQDQTYSVFLLTTQVGGVGLTLTSADRVVIYDPSWNPATDAQAVDRAFRIGQTRNVVVYRLITCGTVEEKIYRRQIFKDSITRQTTGNAKDPYRYFTKQELIELFSLGDPLRSTTQQQLQGMHGMDRRRDPELDEHIAFLKTLPIFGISDHDLMFTQEVPQEEEEEEEEGDFQNGFGSAYDYSVYRDKAELARLLLETESTNQPERSSYGGYGATYGIDGLTGRQQHAEDIVDLTGDDDNVIDLTIEDNLTEVKQVNHLSGCHWKKRYTAEFDEPPLEVVSLPPSLQNLFSSGTMGPNSVDRTYFRSLPFQNVEDQEGKIGYSSIKTIFEEGMNEGPIQWEELINDLSEEPSGVNTTSNGSPEDYGPFDRFISAQDTHSGPVRDPGSENFQTSVHRPLDLSLGGHLPHNPLHYSFTDSLSESAFDDLPQHTTGQHVAQETQAHQLIAQSKDLNISDNLPVFRPVDSLGQNPQTSEKSQNTLTGFSRYPSFAENDNRLSENGTSDQQTSYRWHRPLVLNTESHQDRRADWQSVSEYHDQHRLHENEESRVGFQNPDEHSGFESRQSPNAFENQDHTSFTDGEQSQDILQHLSQRAVPESRLLQGPFDASDPKSLIEVGESQDAFEDPSQQSVLEGKQSQNITEDSDYHSADSGRSPFVGENPRRQSVLEEQSEDVLENPDDHSLANGEQAHVVLEVLDEQPTGERRSPRPLKRSIFRTETAEVTEEEAVYVPKRMRTSTCADTDILFLSEDSMFSSDKSPETDCTDSSMPLYDGGPVVSQHVS